VKWERIGNPKKWGGWGIKYLNIFVMALGAKLSLLIIT